jgi:AraC-like DNA-binding protein
MTQPRYCEYPISPALAPFVKCIWSLENERSIENAPPERILPDSCVELVFHFHDPFCTHFANGKRDIQPQSFAVGQMRQFIEIAPRGRIGFVAVRFSAQGAYRFLPGSLKAIAGQVVDIAEIWKRASSKLTDRIAMASTMTGRIAIVGNMLLTVLADNRREDLLVDRALQLIERNAGELKIADLTSAVGTSTRQLRRRFENAIGVSPKEFSRLTRFVNALRRLRERRQEPLAYVAAASGYYDQAHFNHEFLKLAGATPGELLTGSNVAFR